MFPRKLPSSSEVSEVLRDASSAQLIADLLHVETVVKCVFQGSDSTFVKCGNAAADGAAKATAASALGSGDVNVLYQGGGMTHVPPLVHRRRIGHLSRQRSTRNNWIKMFWKITHQAFSMYMMATGLHLSLSSLCCLLARPCRKGRSTEDLRGKLWLSLCYILKTNVLLNSFTFWPHFFQVYCYSLLLTISFTPQQINSLHIPSSPQSSRVKSTEPSLNKREYSRSKYVVLQKKIYKT